MPKLPYTLAVELSTVLMLWTGLSVWQRNRRTPGGRWFTALTAVIGVWGVGSVLACHETIGSWTRAVMIYVGVIAAPPFLLGVAAHAASIRLVRRLPWFPLALCIPGLFCYGLLFLGPWGDLFLSFDGSHSNPGPLFDIFAGYSYALVATSITLFGLAAYRWPRQGLPVRLMVLSVALVIPLAGNVIYLYSGLDLGFDPTPVLMGLAAVPLRSAIFQGGLFDILPLEQRDLIDGLPVGLLVSDDRRGVIQMNVAAEELLGVPRARALGRSLDALLAGASGQLEIRRSDLQLGRSHAVRCAVLVPSTAATQRAA